MSFIKFQGGSPAGESQRLHWGRAKADGAPYRGPQLPLLKEEEAEALLEQTYDTHFGTFDTSQPNQKHNEHTLQQVLDGAANGWYKLLSFELKWSESTGVPVMYVFVVWTIPYMEPSAEAMKYSTNFLQFRDPHNFHELPNPA